MNKIPTGHFLDGYADIAENQEIMLNTERLGRNSVCINLDVYDHEADQVVKGAGYVQVKQDDADQCFYVTVFGADGDVLSETEVPFNFKEF